MVCEHLRSLEAVMQAAGIAETYRGQAWSQNCREWAYFDCLLDLPALRERFQLPACVVEHVHPGTHDGQEAGFVCASCHDGLMGVHPDRPPRQRFA